MRYENETGRIIVAVTDLARYAYQRENPRLLSERYGFVRLAENGEFPDPFGVDPGPDDGEFSAASPIERGTELHHVLETDAALLEDARTEVPLSRTVQRDELLISVEGYADSISFDGRIHTVEEIKTMRSLPRTLNPLSDPSHFAQAAVYAALFAETSGLGSVKIRLTYQKQSGGERASFEAVFGKETLGRMFDALIERALPFFRAYADRFTVFREETSAMPFPYSSVREGQRAFIQSAYRAARQGRNLLVSAPTGIGKTMSALFPSVKAVGEGLADKIFYFTAKNVTGQAALDAARRLSRSAPHLRTVMISSKESVCPLNKEARKLNTPFRMDCRSCERVDGVTDDFGVTFIPYRERQIRALTELLGSDDPIYTTDRLIRKAEEHRVCPYELSLDLSEACVLIVCDYNYVLDENVRFRRYFKDPGNTEKYLFLFDEAHNLPDRTRAVYSAKLGEDFLAKLSECASSSLPEEADLAAQIGEFADALREVSSLCDEDEYVRSTPDGEVTGAYHQGERVPGNLVRCSANLVRTMRQIERDDAEAGELLRPFSDDLRQFVFAASFFDKHFRFFAHREGDSLLCEILCLDPSGILERMLAAGKSSILFSATLAPTEYFREVTGMRGAETLELPSPYERDHLCLVAYDGVSTRYGDRKETAEDCAGIVYETVSAREGNYLVFFPSYEYMKRVCRAFLALSPDCDVVMQKPGMSRREREKFMSLFRERGRRAMAGFCVLGGMFSEGIDLTGESLIGAVVFGTGMPQLSPERNLMSMYYQETAERGFDFAYLCPGMNKVQQAAGRVIRSEKDVGVVVLADDRFGEPRMKTLFPRHWRHMKYTGDPASLGRILEEFWDAHPAETADKN